MTTPNYRALTLDVLRNAAESLDCTRGGVTSTHTTLHLVGHMLAGTGEIVPLTNGVWKALDSTHAPVVLRLRHGIAKTPTVSLVPLDWGGDDLVYPPRMMMGGNYAATSDSRVSDLVSQLLGHRFYGAIAVHDRRED